MVRKKNKFLSVLQRAGALISVVLILVCCCIPPVNAADIFNGTGGTRLYNTLPFTWVKATASGGGHELIFEFPGRVEFKNSFSSDHTQEFSIAARNNFDYKLVFYYNSGLGLWQFNIVNSSGLSSPSNYSWHFHADAFVPLFYTTGEWPYFDDPDGVFSGGVREVFTSGTFGAYNGYFGFQDRSVDLFPVSDDGVYDLFSSIKGFSDRNSLILGYDLYLDPEDNNLDASDCGFYFHFSVVNPCKLSGILSRNLFAIPSLPDFDAPDATSWLTTAVGGFFSFELFPGFSLGGLFAAIFGLSLLLAFLKLYAGG